MKRTLSMLATVLALVAVLALGLPAQPAAAAKPSKLPDLQCGVAVTTSVVLRADLTCVGLYVPGGSSPVTVDLGGHTLTVPNGRPCIQSPSFCGVVTGGQVTIVNGTIDSSLGLGATLPERVTTLRHVHLLGKITMYRSGPLAVDQSVVEGGIEAHDNVSIHDSKIHNGVTVADYIGERSLDLVGNTITGGSAPGSAALTITSQPAMRLDPDGPYYPPVNHITGTVSDNDISGASGPGVLVTGYGYSGTIVGATVGDLTIARNRVTDNGGDGIDIDRAYGSSGVSVRANTARHNGGHGIEATSAATTGPVTGLIDAGENRASGNALDPQCIGVSCGPNGGRAVPWVSWGSPGTIEVETPIGPSQLDATANVPGTFTYSPPAGTTFAAGNWPITVHFEPDDLSRYVPVDRTVLLNVQRHRSTITWSSKSIIYGTPLGPDQLDATANVPGTFTYTPGPGTLLAPGSRTVQVTFTPEDSANWSPAGTTVTINVAFPPDETLTWNPPAEMTAGPLGPDVLNATASVPGTFTYSPDTGAVLAPGLGQPIRVWFSPSDPQHYVQLQKTITIDVLPPPGPPGSVMLVPGPYPSANLGLVTDTRSVDVDEDGMPDRITATASGGSLFASSLDIATGLGDGTFGYGPTWSWPNVWTPGKGTVSSYPLATGGHLVESGDIDGDGHVDLVVSSRNPDVVTVFLGNGDATFRPQPDQPAGAGLGGLVLADVNRDGHLDLVESNFFTPTVSVLLGDGDGTFAPKVDYAVGNGPKRAAVLDLDGDGSLDLVVPNRLTNTISVLEGRGDGTFDAARNIAVGHGPDTVATSDIDHDGHVDLVVSSSGDAKISILRGDGLGGFLGRTDVTTPALPTGIAIGDFDGDGEPDVAVACTGAASIVVWHGTGTTTLGTSTTVSIYDPGTLVPSDLDGDGRLDLVVGRTRALATDVLMNRTPPPSSSP